MGLITASKILTPALRFFRIIIVNFETRRHINRNLHLSGHLQITIYVGTGRKKEIRCAARLNDTRENESGIVFKLADTSVNTISFDISQKKM